MASRASRRRRRPCSRRGPAISRRAVILGTAGALVVGPDAFLAADEDALRTIASTQGRTFGSAARQADLANNAAYRRVFLTECGLLVPENELKWKALRPSPRQFDFAAADWMADFARKNAIKFKGHTLAWHDALPSWFARTVKRDNARDILAEHIDRVCGHYVGIASSWDVVNEAIDTSSSGLDGLRASPWRTLIGEDYIELAFKTAHRADPTARLIYNDYGLELDSDWDDGRRRRLLRLMRDLLEADTPVHAVGIQSHLEPHRAKFDAKQFETFLHDIAALGLKIVISELDVADRSFAADPAGRDKAVAATYRDYLDVALGNAAVDTIITWGLSDRYSWLNYTKNARRPDGRPTRGLPLSDSLERKPAYAALAQALARKT